MISQFRKKIAKRGFNPCYNGKGIIALGTCARASIRFCFNPCYNGKGIIASAAMPE